MHKSYWESFLKAEVKRQKAAKKLEITTKERNEKRGKVTGNMSASDRGKTYWFYEKYPAELRVFRVCVHDNGGVVVEIVDNPVLLEVGN